MDEVAAPARRPGAAAAAHRAPFSLSASGSIGTLTVLHYGMQTALQDRALTMAFTKFCAVPAPQRVQCAQRDRVDVQSAILQQPHVVAVTGHRALAADAGATVGARASSVLLLEDARKLGLRAWRRRRSASNQPLVPASRPGLDNLFRPPRSFWGRGHALLNIRPVFSLATFSPRRRAIRGRHVHAFIYRRLCSMLHGLRRVTGCAGCCSTAAQAAGRQARRRLARQLEPHVQKLY